MVLTKEFRIVLPMSLEEYEIAQMYMVRKMQQQNTTSTEGIEVLESRPFEDGVFGKGQYTSKVYHLQSKVPAWLTKFAPAHALIMQEEAWNAYPRCKSVLKCPYFTKFQLTIETIHRADSGHSENQLHGFKLFIKQLHSILPICWFFRHLSTVKLTNQVHGLSKEQLAARQVEYIDIAFQGKDCWSHLVGTCSLDFFKFKSARTGRGPLLKGWQERSDPVMTAYKLVTIDAPYWGFGSRLELALIAGERALFLESHRHCFGWIDEWYGMTVQQMYELVQQNDSTLNERLVKPALMMSIDHFDNGSLDSEDICGKNSDLHSQQHAHAIDTPSG